MMVDSLTSIVDKHEKIPVHIKYSIVHDVSLGLCYLHYHDPPIVHRDLSPNNILLTAHHVAKISDLGVAKVIQVDSRKTMTKAPGTIDFMPPESLANSPVYGPSMDVFSFAGIILHTFNQQWPRPTEAIQFDPKTRKMMALSEVERHQQYLDKMMGEQGRIQGGLWGLETPPSKLGLILKQALQIIIIIGAKIIISICTFKRYRTMSEDSRKKQCTTDIRTFFASERLV